MKILSKKSLYIIMGSMVFFLSCDQYVSRDYRIVNISKYEIKFDFIHDNEMPYYQLNLSDFDNKYDFRFDNKGIKESDLHPYIILNADSVNVVFNDSTYLPFSASLSSDRNILLNDAYEIDKGGVYVYTITDDDFAQSIPLPN
ncbi:MAG: hypothetical protein OEY56_09485 [Cyclobacteriaceae bacterium]|nr:hypothetical protein [Cyclobacteriaceae bacterium]